MSPQHKVTNKGSVSAGISIQLPASFGTGEVHLGSTLLVFCRVFLNINASWSAAPRSDSAIPQRDLRLRVLEEASLQANATSNATANSTAGEHHGKCDSEGGSEEGGEEGGEDRVGEHNH